MINYRASAVVRLWLCSVLIGGCVGFASRANATTFCPYQPPPGVCSESPGIPGFTPGYSPVPGVPGTWGPTGLYTPVQGGISDAPHMGGKLP